MTAMKSRVVMDLMFGAFQAIKSGIVVDSNNNNVPIDVQGLVMPLSTRMLQCIILIFLLLGIWFMKFAWKSHVLLVSLGFYNIPGKKIFESLKSHWKSWDFMASWLYEHLYNICTYKKKHLWEKYLWFSQWLFVPQIYILWVKISYCEII